MKGPGNIGEAAQRNVVEFSYDELVTATIDFRMWLGYGRFGYLYRGNLERTGQAVVVKNLRNYTTSDRNAFVENISVLSRLQHPNLANLIGYCAERHRRFLVYEFVPLGSLRTHLFEQRRGLAVEVMDWDTRMKIALGAARGLNYLHNETNPPVLFRELRSSNILLDEGFQPKLSDYGLAQFENPHYSNRNRGDAYVAPEYNSHPGGHTIKTDVYSFGIVHFDLISGDRPSAFIKKGHFNLSME